MKCLTLFTEKFSCKYLFQHNLRCSQTDLNVSEHSKMFPNKLELFLIIKNIIKCSKLLKMFPKQMWNSFLIIQNITKCLTKHYWEFFCQKFFCVNNILEHSEMLPNKSKMFPNKVLNVLELNRFQTNTMCSELLEMF